MTRKISLAELTLRPVDLASMEKKEEKEKKSKEDEQKDPSPYCLLSLSKWAELTILLKNETSSVGVLIGPLLPRSDVCLRIYTKGLGAKFNAGVSH